MASTGPAVLLRDEAQILADGRGEQHCTELGSAISIDAQG
jgi:hypothetical protein